MTPRMDLRGPNPSVASLTTSRAMAAAPSTVSIGPLFPTGGYQWEPNATIVSNVPLDASGSSLAPSPLSTMSSSGMERHRDHYEH